MPNNCHISSIKTDGQRILAEYIKKHTFHSINAPIMNGLKTVTKHRIEVGSKLLTLAILPVPKKAESKKKI
jgi:hypothetical protein